MEQDNQTQLKEIDKKILITTLIDGLATLVFVLAAYTKFWSKGSPLHPILANDLLVYAMLGVGGAIMVWGGLRLFALRRQKGNVENT